MKKIITLLIIIGLTISAAFFTPILMKDPGYFLLRFAGYEIEMRVTVAFALFIIAIMLFWLLVYFIRLPKKTVTTLTSNRSRKSFAKGLLLLSEGKWKQAEKQLLISAKNSPTPQLSYMAAARAATAQNNISDAFSYLDEAEMCTDNPLTVDLTRCELWINIAQYDKAINLLNRILSSYPNNPKALKLMTQASHQSGQWQQLRSVLPKVEKLAIISPDKALQLTQLTIAEQLNQAQTDSELIEIWKGLNKKQKQENLYVIAYAQNGLKLGITNEISKLCENLLFKNMDEKLLQIWSQLPIGNNEKIKTAEKWLKKNPDNSLLLQLLGKLSLKEKMMEKAKSYLQQSLEIDASAQTYTLLAHYFDAVGETENALKAYQQAEGKTQQLILIDDSDSILEVS